METFSRKGIIKRVISSSEHADLLAEHRDKLQHAITLFQVRLYSSSTLQILINVSDTGDRPNGHPYGWGHGRIDNTPGQHLRLGWVRGVHTRFPSIRLAHIYMWF